MLPQNPATGASAHAGSDGQSPRAVHSHHPRAKPRGRPDPVARPEDVNWRDPRIKTYLLNLLDDPAGPFAAIDCKSRALCKQLLHHRNPHTGDIFPSCGRLAFELSFKERAIRYTLGRLDTGPSRQRDGELVDGHGLIWREKCWRPYGGQTSNAYGFTCRFLQMAGLVLPHECSSVCSGSACNGTAKTKGPRRGQSPRPVTASLPLPKVQMQPPPTSAPVEAPPADPDFETFALIFAAERFAKYGDHDTGTVRAENRTTVASYVLDVTAEACAWALGRGLELERDVVREDLCRRLARLWLARTGTNGFLDERRHPIGLIVGDLQRVGPEALAAWKRVQPRPKVAPLSPPPADEEPHEAEAWPELDASEPTADELVAARAELAGGAEAEDSLTSASCMTLALTGNALFDRAAEQTRANSPVAFDQWFRGVQFEGLADGVLSLRVQNEFVLDWVRQQFFPTLIDKIREQTGTHVEVSWAVDPHLSLPLVRYQPPAIDGLPRVVEISDDEDGDEPASVMAVLEDEPALVPEDDELAPLRAKLAEIRARGGSEAPRPVLPSHADEIEAHDGEEAAPVPAEEQLTRGGYGAVNAPPAEFLRVQTTRSSGEPMPRRGRSVRTRIALRSRPVGAAPPPEAEEEATEAEEAPSEASAAHPRRRHARSRLGLSYEHAPPSEAAVEPPREGDGERGDEDPGSVSKR